MTNTRETELLLRAHFEERADRSVGEGQLAAILARTAGRRQRPGWLAGMRSPSMTATTLTRTTIPRAAWLAAAVGLIVLTLLAVFAIGRPNQPATPVNGQIVFGRFSETAGDTLVYVANPDGTKVRQLRSEPHEGPFWSPDGRQIGLGAAVINADGTGYREWDQSGNTFNVVCWDWSPDGDRMLCEGFSDDSEADLEIHGVYSVRASDGKDLVRLSVPGRAAVPGAYSPDGKHVLWVESCQDESRCELVVANVDGSGQRRLTTRLFSAAATWAPDGRSILASSGGRLFSVSVESAAMTAVTIEGLPFVDIWKGQWSPDGTRILIHRNMGESNNDLFTMLADGSDLVQVTTDPADDRFSDWGTHPIE